MDKRLVLVITAAMCFLAGCQNGSKERTEQAAGTDRADSGYKFERGYPAAGTVQKSYDEADLNRAIQAYRFFYPSVSGVGNFVGGAKAGLVLNKIFGVQQTLPRHVGFTLNSDTPYGPILLDLREGPMVVELPPGPTLGAVLDVSQRWISDLGVPGRDAGKGGKYLLLPPGYTGKVPSGYYPAQCSSYRTVVGVRAIPAGGDMAGAVALLKKIKVHPLEPGAAWTEPTWIDLTPKSLDFSPLAWEKNIQYWEELHDVIENDPPYEPDRDAYGDLAVLGIAKGKPFAPDDRMRHILEQAAQIANAQMRVESLADRRPDRVVWPDRKWEWAALRYENGDFALPDYTDLVARDKWFFQAVATSPAMFRRSVGWGSLYWLGLRDATGTYLDGGKTYKLTVPQPIPAKLFWSVTVYDSETRSQIQTGQGKAALRSLFELKGIPASAPTELYFGPSAPVGKEGQWIRTIPGKGWFVYFRIYGPGQPAFDGSWKPGDFETAS